MKILYSSVLALTLFVVSLKAVAQPLPDLPDAIGRAGMMAAVVLDEDGHEAVLAAGGANFPDGLPWEGGAKRFYRDIFLLRQTQGEWRWEKVGDLPEANAYAAFCATPDRKGLVIAGGANAQGHLDHVWVVRSNGRVEVFGAKLPSPRAYAGCVAVSGSLRIVGGAGAPESVDCLANALILDLITPDQGWRVDVESQRCARILPLCGGFAGKFVWGGGCRFEERDGKAARVYLNDLRGNLGVNGARSALAAPLAACAGPGVELAGGLIFVGGDDGLHPGTDLKSHPGHSNQVTFLYGETLATVVVGQWPTSLVTAPLVRLGDDIISISGETRPGVRTSAVSRWQIPPQYR